LEKNSEFRGQDSYLLKLLYFTFFYNQYSLNQVNYRRNPDKILQGKNKEQEKTANTLFIKNFSTPNLLFFFSPLNITHNRASQKIME